jgi:hypothetical protein
MAKRTRKPFSDAQKKFRKKISNVKLGRIIIRAQAITFQEVYVDIKPNRKIPKRTKKMLKKFQKRKLQKNRVQLKAIINGTETERK